MDIKKTIAALALMTLTPTLAHASPPPKIGRLIMPAPLLLPWIRACAITYDVDPEFALAVAIVESRPAGGGMEIRVGPIGKRGKYVGPMGIARCFKNKYDIYNPFINIEVGIKALRGDERKALKRYNTLFNNSYYQEIKRIKKQLKEGDGCDIKITSRYDVTSTATALTTTKPLGRFRQ